MAQAPLQTDIGITDRDLRVFSKDGLASKRFLESAPKKPFVENQRLGHPLVGARAATVLVQIEGLRLSPAYTASLSKRFYKLSVAIS